MEQPGYEEWEPEEGGADYEEEEPEAELSAGGDEEGEDEEAAPFGGGEPARVRPAIARRVFARPASGLQYATVSTPAGQARIKLPRRVATVSELNVATSRLAREVASQAATLRRLDAQYAEVRRVARRLDRAGTRAANTGLLVQLVEQVKDVVLDVVAIRAGVSAVGPNVRPGANGSGRSPAEPSREDAGGTPHA